MFSKISGLFKDIASEIRNNKFDRKLMRYFDWPLFLMVICITLFGVVVIFSATSSSVLETPSNLIEMLQTQSIKYPRLQLMWLMVGIGLMAVMIYPPFDLYRRFANVIYWGNVIMLLVTLFIARVGRGGMTAFLSWGGGERGFQTSEFGKVAMIISFANWFSVRKKPIMKWGEVFTLGAYTLLPLILILLQPDVGTALVYVFMFCVMILVSGSNKNLIWTVIFLVVLFAVPVWYFINNTSSDNFRFTRILIWLDPEAYPDEARQIINGQIAIGSGGLFGKGIISPGSFASLGFISDDHTDFIFAIVCESFGLVGGVALVLAYALLIGRMLVIATKIHDPFGAFVVVGVMGMLLFHVVENVGMVIGVLPVTGIPLPFVSYGGSNMLTNMAGIGLAENVIMRSRQRAAEKKIGNNRTIRV